MPWIYLLNCEIRGSTLRHYLNSRLHKLIHVFCLTKASAVSIGQRLSEGWRPRSHASQKLMSNVPYQGSGVAHNHTHALACTHVCALTNTHTHMKRRMNIYMCDVCIYMYICGYTYAYCIPIYTNIHIHILIYEHIHAWRQPWCRGSPRGRGSRWLVTVRILPRWLERRPLRGLLT